MITQIILDTFMNIFIFMFSIFPSFPPMPEIIVDGFNWFVNASDSGTGLITYVLGTELFYVTLGLVIFLTTFDYIYHFVIRFIIMRVVMGFIGR